MTNENHCYQCGGEFLGKDLTETEDGEYICEECNKPTYAVMFFDCTYWVTADKEEAIRQAKAIGRKKYPNINLGVAIRRDKDHAYSFDEFVNPDTNCDLDEYPVHVGSIQDSED